VTWNFSIQYTSGRQETLRRESNGKAKELRDDLLKAIKIGSVASFEEDSYENKNDMRSGKKRGSTIHLKPETREEIRRRALDAGQSFSEYMRNLAEQDVCAQ
jgi:hypothetical protein